MEDAEFLEESQEYAPYDKLENVLKGWNGSTPLTITPEQVERLKLLAFICLFKPNKLRLTTKGINGIAGKENGEGSAGDRLGLVTAALRGTTTICCRL